jgi:serine/threonine-protein kinase RsbW
MEQKSKVVNHRIPGPCDFGTERLALKAEWIIPSCLELIDDVIRKVTNLVKKSWPREVRERVELALHEALVNAIVHGSRNKPANSIRICLGVAEDGKLLLAVKDTGPGFDVKKIANPLREDRIMAPRGRGIFLIQELMDTVSFSFKDGTEVRMMLKPSQRVPSVTAA